MNSHLRNDLDKLRGRILKVAIAVEENLRFAVKALRELSSDTADAVIRRDIEIDVSEVETEEECLKILALHQPVASDLRFVVTVLKINGELEHIGDMAANIARRVNYAKSETPVKMPFDLDTMSSRTVYMLKSSIDAFLSGDSKLAIGVCDDDEIIDEENRKCYLAVRKMIENNPSEAMALINWLLVSKAFERIADMCTNIAEDVIYLRHSVIARHNIREAARIVSEEDSIPDEE